MSKILITGGTGNLGKALVKILDKNNISYTIASRKNKSGASNVAVMDLVHNKGIEKAVADKDIIFHLATDMKKDTEATRNLLQAMQPEANVHLVYISIVGIDEVPFAYYQQKLASEEEIKRSGIPYTILRATQFHEFIDDIFSKLLNILSDCCLKKLLHSPYR
ncbi:SDR family oxidoreductase [Chryseobacterium arachidis]|uniref:SDR family oxidoreductase n=1 Tax=Chryseobacterium arachidis TaxID=1416778 RepID=UPI003620952D